MARRKGAPHNCPNMVTLWHTPRFVLRDEAATPKSSEHRPACSWTCIHGQAKHEGHKSYQFKRKTALLSLNLENLGTAMGQAARVQGAGDTPQLWFDTDRYYYAGLTCFVCFGGPAAQFPMASSLPWPPACAGKEGC